MARENNFVTITPSGEDGFDLPQEAARFIKTFDFHFPVDTVMITGSDHSYTFAMSATVQTPIPFHVMSKPGGPRCNLDCTYCFYLDKELLFPPAHRFRMPDDVLEKYIHDYIDSQPTREITFAWQGGEPTLLGVNFFRKVVELQKKYAGQHQITNALQTNGTVLDDEWGCFLHENNFLVGISIDGPRELHDAYRVDRRGQSSFDRVMRGINVLKRNKVEFNTLTVVNNLNAKHPKDVYRFLTKIGSTYLQFIPLVEREVSAPGTATCLAPPPQSPLPENGEARVSDWSVRPDDYGTFLTTIFNHWVRRDVGRIYVQLFDCTLGAWIGAGPGLCVHAPECGNALAMEHNGDVYACDHYVYPDYRLGNVATDSFQAMLHSPKQIEFGKSKTTSLPEYCLSCTYRFACNGGCPKHRFMTTPAGDPGLNYLCSGYKKFFKSSEPAMRQMATLLKAGKAPADIMG